MNGIFQQYSNQYGSGKSTKIFKSSPSSLDLLVASFFDSSNFMQINVGSGSQVGYIDFAGYDAQLVDAMMLPTLALYFFDNLCV